MHNQIFTGNAADVLRSMRAESVQTCVTSPPYFGLRDYGNKKQIGLEQSPEEYIEKLRDVFREVNRVLRSDGTLWLNLADSYRQKQLIGIPLRMAFALQADGWFLRQDIIWHKPNPMPERVTDRCTKGHEYVFLLSKTADYYFDHRAIREPAAYDGRKDLQMKGSPKYQAKVVPGKGAHVLAARAHARWQRGKNGEFLRNRRSVWTVATKSYQGTHFAAFPRALIEPCILAGSPRDGIVLDPFLGSGTTAAAAQSLGRRYIGIELNRDYVALARQRLRSVIASQQAA
jgi:site-specific DNA-methyltransferase (adenine-specific)